MLFGCDLVLGSSSINTTRIGYRQKSLPRSPMTTLPVSLSIWFDRTLQKIVGPPVKPTYESFKMDFLEAEFPFENTDFQVPCFSSLESLESERETPEPIPITFTD